MNLCDYSYWLEKLIASRVLSIFQLVQPHIWNIHKNLFFRCRRGSLFFPDNGYKADKVFECLSEQTHLTICRQIGVFRIISLVK